jgi:hypothetical protein
MNRWHFVLLGRVSALHDRLKGAATSYEFIGLDALMKFLNLIVFYQPLLEETKAELEKEHGTTIPNLPVPDDVLKTYKLI